ncbi:MAG: filament integrity protein FraC [Elainellaceae cyanobacterium]
METVVLPFRLIVNQALLLLLAIAIEAMVLRQRLRYPPRKSIEYSASLNLWSTLIGWLIFFAAAGSIPFIPALRMELINFIFFNRWSTDLFSGLVIVGFFTFFITVIVELVGFILLQWLRQEQESLESSYGRSRRGLTLDILPRRSRRGLVASTSTDEVREASRLSALLAANAVSYLAVVVVLATLQLVMQA